MSCPAERLFLLRDQSTVGSHKGYVSITQEEWYGEKIAFPSLSRFWRGIT